jgi:hypothetical protein
MRSADIIADISRSAATRILASGRPMRNTLIICDDLGLTGLYLSLRVKDFGIDGADAGPLSCLQHACPHRCVTLKSTGVVQKTSSAVNKKPSCCWDGTALFVTFK